MKGKTGAQGTVRHKGPYVANNRLVADYYAERSQEKREPQKDRNAALKATVRVRARWDLADVAHMRWLHENGVVLKAIAEHYEMQRDYAANLIVHRYNYTEVEAEKDPSGWSPFDVKP